MLKMRDERLKPVWSMKKAKAIDVNINQRHGNNMMHFNQLQKTMQKFI